MLSTLLNGIIGLFFPAACVGCETPGTYCCSTCFEKLAPAATPSDRSLIALFNYHDLRVKKLIWLLKYRGGRDIARILAAPLYERVLDEIVEIEMFHPALDEPWLIVPIPLTRGKLHRRGFNQTEEIAKCLLRHNSRNFEPGFEVLKRVADRRSQMSIKDRTARWENVGGAFAVPAADQVRGRNVLLIDDVTTTGATLSEARRVLHQAGARTILTAAIAHG